MKLPAGTYSCLFLGWQRGAITKAIRESGALKRLLYSKGEFAIRLVVPQSLQILCHFDTKPLQSSPRSARKESPSAGRQLFAFTVIYGPCKAVALTGFSMASDIKQYKEAGFDGWLIKPVHPDLLLSTVKQILDDSKGD